ncbi:hypothetical protein BIW11_11939 [Tropilaelaps mercedesae]|uniref:ZSWIM3 N-terminal domain-containing protein n=1 Tax=Tropilaelaps mercedesae TaxID=418985 RepID=A0A1V9X9B8_9ACAR|nr:hypothetical protein BIW11_11939 [Tropilaelaps mercedesae]
MPSMRHVHKHIRALDHCMAAAIVHVGIFTALNEISFRLYTKCVISFGKSQRGKRSNIAEYIGAVMATQVIQREAPGFLPVVLMKPVTQSPAKTMPTANVPVKEEVRSSSRTIALLKTADVPELASQQVQQAQQIRLLAVQVAPIQVPSTPSSPVTSSEFCVDPTRAVYPGLHLGATFDSYEELTNLVSKFQMAKGVHLYVRSSRKLYPALNQMGEVIRDYNQDLIFAEVYYACTRGGRRFVRRANGNEELRNCPFNIKVRLTKDGQKLYIRDICPAHNHVLERVSNYYLLVFYEKVWRDITYIAHTARLCALQLKQGVVPRPVTHTPPAFEEVVQRPRVKIMKPPSILTRPPIIQTLVRGELIKDPDGSTRQVILLPSNNSRTPLSQKIVPITMSQSKATNFSIETSTMASVGAAASSSMNPVPVNAIQSVLPTTATTTAMATHDDAGAQDVNQVRIKEEPNDGDIDPEAPVAASPGNGETKLESIVKLEATSDDVEQNVFDASEECAEESDERIVPDDGDCGTGEVRDGVLSDHEPDDDQAYGSDMAKRPRMTLDLPCADGRFVMTRQNVLDTMKFCCECGTRVSERYYSDKPDRLAVTLVCEQGHTTDWLLQKIIRKKLPYQVRLPGLLSPLRTVKSIQQQQQQRAA